MTVPETANELYFTMFFWTVMIVLGFLIEHKWG